MTEEERPDVVQGRPHPSDRNAGNGPDGQPKPRQRQYASTMMIPNISRSKPKVGNGDARALTQMSSADRR